jgi:hypothetical protein
LGLVCVFCFIFENIGETDKNNTENNAQHRGKQADGAWKMDVLSKTSVSF